MRSSTLPGLLFAGLHPSSARVLLITFFVLLLCIPLAARDTLSRKNVTQTVLASLRVPFIPNMGQADPVVAFSTLTSVGTVAVMRDGTIAYAFRGARNAHLEESLLGGSPKPTPGARTATEVSYFLGAHPKDWRDGLPTYESVELGEVWPGIGVSLRSTGDSVEKLFTLAPGVSPQRIRVNVGGSEKLRLGPGGSLLARTEAREVKFSAPVAYQEKWGKRVPVSAAYVLQGTNYGFRLGAYDPSLPVVIDPILQSTYLGERSEAIVHDIAVHPLNGDVYVVGGAGEGFPGTSGGAQPAGTGAFVARLNPGLTTLIQATYLGGSRGQTALSLAIAPDSGDIVVAGTTSSTDFPGTAGSAQPAYRGGGDAFVARLSAGLTSLIRATYFGGSDTEDRIAVTLHPVSGDVLITGLTFSTDLPGVTGGAQPVHGGGGEDAFVARHNATLTTLQQATYAGGIGSDGGEAVAIHPSSDEIFVTGFAHSLNFPGTSGGAQPTQSNRGSFVARFTPGLTALTQATYVGGSGLDEAVDLVIHPPSGDVLVTGVTNSPDFPGTAGGVQPAIRSGHFDAFVARFTASLRTLVQATYLGGSESDDAFDIALFPGGADNILVGGITSSHDFPGTAGGAQPAIGNPGGADAYAARLTADLTQLRQATYLGGSSTETPLAWTVSTQTGDVYIAGYTRSVDFPRTAGGVQEFRRGVFIDGFVSRLSGDLSSVAGQTASVPFLSWPGLTLLALVIASCGFFLLRRG